MGRKLLEVTASVKLGRCDSCGLPFSAPERISEQALSCLLERASIVISEAGFTAITQDRHDVVAMELARLTIG